MINKVAQVIAHAEMLERKAGDIHSYSLPELRESDALEVFDAVRESERNLFSSSSDNSAYFEGTALFADDMHIVRGQNPALITGEHATSHPRREEIIYADAGTGGLGERLRIDLGTSFVAMLGLQTGDPNFDNQHPMKREITKMMRDQRPKVVIGLHGYPDGKFGSLEDDRAYNAILGIGNNPNEQSVEVAEAACITGADLGLKVVVNTPHIRFRNGRPILDANGNLTYMALKAAGPNTTRSHEQRVAEQIPYQPALVQVELSSFLRFNYDTADTYGAAMGVYLGYRLTRSILEHGLSLTPPTPSDS